MQNKTSPGALEILHDMVGYKHIVYSETIRYNFVYPKNEGKTLVTSFDDVLVCV